MPVYSEDGKQVAIQYVQPIRKYVELPYDPKRGYVFDVQASISLTWVNVGQDENYILGLRDGCCGNKHPGAYFYANADNLRRWTNRGGR